MMEDPSHDPTDWRRKLGRRRAVWPPPVALVVVSVLVSAAILAIGIYNLAIGSWRGPGVMVIWGVLTAGNAAGLMNARHRARSEEATSRRHLPATQTSAGRAWWHK
jgi:hypothetical protein